MKYLKFTIIMAVLLICFGVVEYASAESYYAQGVLKSENVLSGADITDITDFRVTAEVPASTTVSVSFSQDKTVYYSASGTKGAWTDVASGTSIIDMSELSWTGSLLFYKLKLATTDASSTPTVGEIRVNYTGDDVPAVTGTKYGAWGVVVSDNMLSGMEVSSITGFLATTTLPSGTSARVAFSQDKSSFYSASGTKGAWTELVNGGNTIDLTGLSWAGSSMYYKVRLEALVDSTVQPKLMEVRAVYDGAEVAGISMGDYDWSGVLLSGDLLASSTNPMTGYERFGYAIKYLPFGATVKAQFSTDGTNFYSSDGTAWGWDTLSAGENTGPTASIDLFGLGWKNSASFYYKLKFDLGTDNAVSPIITKAGLVAYSAVFGGGTKRADPVLHLKFDEGYGGTVYDWSENKNNGTLYPGTGGTNTASSAMWILDGKFGKAMEFDGTDDRVVISNFQFPISNQFSISQFINLQTLSTSKPLLSHWSTNQYNILIKTDDTNSDELKICVADALTDNCTNYGYTTNINLSTNQWKHASVVFDGSQSTNTNKLKLYLDGEQKTLSFSGTLPSTTQYDASSALEIGGNSSLPAYTSAVIDEVKIWNYALSEDEVKTEYNGGAATFGVSNTANNNGTTVTGKSADYCVPGDTALCDAPVLELKMDEKTGTTTYDTSGNGNDGVFVNSASSPTWTRGKMGGALSFDGANDNVTVTDSSSLDIEGNLTLSAWIKKNSHPLAGNYETIVSKGTNGSFEYNYVLRTFGQTNNIEYLYFFYRSNSTSHALKATTTSLQINKWHHVEVSFNDTANLIKIYVDGILQNNIITLGDPENNSLTANNRVLYLGASDPSTTQFNGLIDEVRIYNYARTPAQIAWDYNRGKPIAEWKFDECQGDQVFDWVPNAEGKAGNQNPGTITIGAGGTQTELGTCASSSAASAWYNGVNGKINKSLSFDGTDDYVNAGNASILKPTIPFTASGWVKTDSGSGRIVSAGPANGGSINYAGWYLRTDGTFRGGDGSGKTSADRFGRDVVKSASDGNWNHVAVVVSAANNINLYLNGIPNSGNYDGTATSLGYDASNILVGAHENNGTPAYFANGQIDEVKIWNYALTAEQVKTEYNGGAVRFGN